MNIIDGEPGAVWTNDTPKILWQFRCTFNNSCAICIQYSNKIGTYWPIPIHINCACSNIKVRPGEQAEPFIDYVARVRAMDHEERAKVMGVSNWALVESGAVKWGDVVTRSRIKDFNQVVSEKRFSINDLINSGVKPGQARKAYESVHTAKHQTITKAQTNLIKALKGHGVSDERIAKEVGESIATRVFIRKAPDLPIGVSPAPKPPVPPVPIAPRPRVPQGTDKPPIEIKPAKPTFKPQPPEIISPKQSVAPINVPEAARPHIERAMDIGKANGVEVSPQPTAWFVSRHGEMGERMPALYSSHVKTIYLNSENDYWLDPEKKGGEWRDINWMSSRNPDHIIHHEIGHAKQNELLGDAGYYATRNVMLQSIDKKIIIKEVSQYATTSSREFVAEYYAGVQSGKQYSEEVTSLYLKYLEMME